MVTFSPANMEMKSLHAAALSLHCGFTCCSVLLSQCYAFSTLLFFKVQLKFYQAMFKCRTSASYRRYFINGSMQALLAIQRPPCKPSS